MDVGPAGRRLTCLVRFGISHPFTSCKDGRPLARSRRVPSTGAPLRLLRDVLVKRRCFLHIGLETVELQLHNRVGAVRYLVIKTFPTPHVATFANIPLASVPLRILVQRFCNSPALSGMQWTSTSSGRTELIDHGAPFFRRHLSKTILRSGPLPVTVAEVA